MANAAKKNAGKHIPKNHRSRSVVGVHMRTKRKEDIEKEKEAEKKRIEEREAKKAERAKKKREEEEEICVICMEKRGDWRKLWQCSTCKVKYHIKCINEWNQHSNECPTCRKHIFAHI